MTAALAALLALAGCSHVLPLPAAPPNPEDANASFPRLEDRNDLLIGVALSGGGSRAAYFGAQGLEALAGLRHGDRSILQSVTHLSSVSGGSVAASYFAMEKPPGRTAVLKPDGTLSPEYRNFFDAYQTAMAKNFQGALEWRQVYKFRWLNSSKRATSLAEVLDAEFLHGRTLGDLYVREQHGDSPRLILNSTLYNNGRRFVTTTLPADDFKYDFITRFEKELQEKEHIMRPLPAALTRSRDALNPLGFQDFGADPRKVHLSYGVAASASFPFFIGPVTVQIEGQDTYLHAGDGGLFDNQGTESLVELLLKKIAAAQAANKPMRALVIAFDSSFPFAANNDLYKWTENGFDIFVKDPGRIVGIMEQRANSYQALLWHILQGKHVVLPGDEIIQVIVIRHTEDVWPREMKDLPVELVAACRDDGIEFPTREALLRRLALIETLFKLPSACDKALLREAAFRAVDSKKQEIVEFLGGKTTAAH